MAAARDPQKKRHAISHAWSWFSMHRDDTADDSQDNDICLLHIDSDKKKRTPNQAK